MRIRLVAMAAVLGAGCLPNCAGDPGGTGGGGGSSSSTSFSYDLVSGLGEWTVTGTATSSSCVRNTTSSKIVLTLPRPRENEVRYTPKTGVLSGSFDLDLNRPARQGTEVCGTTAPTTCPRQADTPFDSSAFFTFERLEPALPANAPSGFAFVPIIQFELPQLCDYQYYDTSPAYQRGKPISVAQLLSGQFVVEGSGSAPIFARTTSPTDTVPALTGGLSWTFRFVFQTTEHDPSKAVAAPNLTVYDECLLDQPSTLADLEAASVAFADGGTDIPLNAYGCRRLKATHGEVSSLRHERTRGTKLIYDPATDTTRSERDSYVAYQEDVDGAGEQERVDGDGDGIFETVTDRTFDATEEWTRTVTKELDLAGATVRQYTRARLDPLTMSVSVEERLNGALTPVEAFVAPITQNSCFSATSMKAPDCSPPPGPVPTCGGTKALCSKTKRDELINAMKDALDKGDKCLEKAGFKTSDPKGQGLTWIPAGKLNFYCDTDPCGPYGSLGTETKKRGKRDLTINVVRNSSPAELLSTLFHEMMHGDPRFIHNDELVAAAANACKLSLSDRTTACEAMCFKPAAAGACACTRCLSASSFDPPTKEVCEKCKDYGACPGRFETSAAGTRFAVSQAIGAWCDRTKTFCDTKAECDSQCVGTACRPIKATCDAGCN